MANSFADSLPAFSNAITNLVRRTGPSIVGVHSQRARGSGFVWRAGRIVTADEALADEGPVEVVLPGGDVVPVTVKGRDPSTDVALLSVERTELPLACDPQPSDSPSAIETGALAVVVGARDGMPVAALGIVAHAGPAWRSLRGGRIDARLELGVTPRRSSEGALAFDASGRPFGMVVFGPRRRALVIPMRTIDRVAAQLDAEGRIARGYLGLGLQPVRTPAGDIGAMVMSVDGDGPAARAGVRQGDVVVRLNARAIDGVSTLLHALGSESVGTTLRLGARRADEPIEFDVTIGKRPDA